MTSGQDFGVFVMVWISGGIDDTQAQQVKVGSAVHGAFDQLQSVNMPFDWAVAPGPLKCSKNGFLVAAEVLGEVCQRACGSGIVPT